MVDSSLWYEHDYIPISFQNSLLCLVNDFLKIDIEQLFVYVGMNQHLTLL